jgi:hypothetical protein
MHEWSHEGRLRQTEVNDNNISAKYEYRAWNCVTDRWAAQNVSSLSLKLRCEPGQLLHRGIKVAKLFCSSEPYVMSHLCSSLPHPTRHPPPPTRDILQILPSRSATQSKGTLVMVVLWRECNTEINSVHIETQAALRKTLDEIMFLKFRRNIYGNMSHIQTCSRSK